MRKLIVVVLYAVCMMSMICCGPVSDHDATVAKFDDDARHPADIAAEIYALEHNTLSAECLEYAYAADFIPMDAGALGVQCGFKRGAADACFFQFDVKGVKFAILTELQHSKHIQVHEYLHFMLQCQANDWRASDNLHVDAVWSYVDPDQMGQSAERRD